MTETNQQILKRHDASVRGRALLEILIVNELLRRLASAGFENIAVDDGGDKIKGTHQELVAAVFSVDQSTVFAWRDKKLHWVTLVMGNDGYDVICDYSTRLETLMEQLEGWIDECGYVAS